MCECGVDVELLVEVFVVEKGLLFFEVVVRRLLVRSWLGNVCELKVMVEVVLVIVLGEGRVVIDVEDFGFDEELKESCFGYYEWF